jgi:hypothetical protein
MSQKETTHLVALVDELQKNYESALSTAKHLLSLKDQLTDVLEDRIAQLERQAKTTIIFGIFLGLSLACISLVLTALLF